MSWRAAGLLLLCGAVAAGAAVSGCAAPRAASAPRVIVLGFDGMDYALTERLMRAGRMPHFAQLAREGWFQPLGTSVPPLSPVAWSDFVTGLDAGGHGIFDFIHRDPSTMVPYLSTSRSEPPTRMVRLGRWQFPLSGGRVELLRHGRAFWSLLEAEGVRTTILRMPANFPPSEEASRELSGMGTPDLLGTYGTFSFYTTDPFYPKKDVSGGRVLKLSLREGVARGVLYGPDNPFLQEKRKVSLELVLYIDRQARAAKLEIGGESRILREGEWSDWVPIAFPLIPTQSLPGMCRFYLRSVAPEVELYASPINFDPFAPAQPISHPDDYAAELARSTGRFYTQGMPEDTKALTEGIFTRDEFLAQARIAMEELVHQYEHVLSGFDAGLLFYYFGGIDQVSHVLWRTMDPEHPAYDPQRDPPYAEVIPRLYEQADRIVGYTLERMPPGTLLIVMSDHGFASWRRAFHLNAWLREQGYLAVKNPNLEDDPGLFVNVDWSRTRAYALGINGLYVNLRGRERHGIVPPEEREPLMREIARKLLETVDPATGRPAITKVYLREEAYRDRGHLEVGPDIVVGYAKGTRGSNESALGAVPREVFTDNRDEWSGDHAMDHETVPGILLANRSLARPVARLSDLAGAVLEALGVREGFPGTEKP